jgi:predicted O-methyltransferase YrrM
MDDVDRLLARVKRDARGWLPLPVYRGLYDTAAAADGGAFVEIGTAQGAATIALALGAKAAGKPFRIHTADQFILGSRPLGRSAEEKHEIVRRGFDALDVAESIASIIGSAADLPVAAELPRIDLLLIDADGLIDRDLALLHDRLAPGCPIIVDDIDDAIYTHRREGGLLVDQKHRLTALLLREFVEAGLLVPSHAIGQTGWYRKGPASLPAAEIELLALPAYRALVRARLTAANFGMKRAVHDLMDARAPWLTRAWRALRGGRGG